MPGLNDQKNDETTPLVEYERRRSSRRQLALRCRHLHGRIANARIIVVVLAGGLACLTWSQPEIGGPGLGVAALAFVGLVVWHERVRQARARAEKAVAFYDKAIARLQHHWAGNGESGARFLDETHTYAVDLDLFGSGSLFELLCTARTRQGEDTLASWLKAPAPPDEIQSRQSAVDELRPRLDLREDIALLASDLPAVVNYDRLAEWGKAPRLRFHPRARLAGGLLALWAVAMLAAWAASAVPLYLVLPALVAEAGFAIRFHRRVQLVLGPVERRARDLSLLSGLLARFEREPFRTPRLSQLQALLRATGGGPSRQIRQLLRLIEWLTAQNNLLFAPLAPFLLWNTQFAFAIEAWRSRSGPAIGRWLKAIGELESLCAFATYAFDNPGDPFPEIETEAACFRAEALGHPLLPKEQCITNDVHLGEEPQLWIVSGSNMSGKSTLLRTVGVNTVLALAGATVRAKRLKISPLMIGATLRIQDSLADNRSRFFAEITRLRQLLDLTQGSPPLLFLLDELLQGTNSHDRRIGAEAVLKSFIDRGAIGLVTTHDLALTQIADRLAPRAANVHFEDQLHDGKMTFDYRVHSGVVQHSNALALMRAVGIDV